MSEPFHEANERLRERKRIENDKDAEIERLEECYKGEIENRLLIASSHDKCVAEIEKTALIMLEQAKALDKLLHDIERLHGAIEKALPNIHQENDREAYEILEQALKEHDGE